jgi:hypothetical protein
MRGTFYNVLVKRKKAFLTMRKEQDQVLKYKYSAVAASVLDSRLRGNDMMQDEISSDTPIPDSELKMISRRQGGGAGGVCTNTLRTPTKQPTKIAL